MRSCVRGEENVCHAGYTGLIVGARAFGGVADYMRVPAEFAYVRHSSRRARFPPPPRRRCGARVLPYTRHWRGGCHVAVLGVGGLGHLALQFADALGGVVTAVVILVMAFGLYIEFGVLASDPSRECVQSPDYCGPLERRESWAASGGRPGCGMFKIPG